MLAREMRMFVTAVAASNRRLIMATTSGYGINVNCDFPTAIHNNA